jgi:hypothetical protein
MKTNKIVSPLALAMGLDNTHLRKRVQHWLAYRDMVRSRLSPIKQKLSFVRCTDVYYGDGRVEIVADLRGTENNQMRVMNFTRIVVGRRAA